MSLTQSVAQFVVSTPADELPPSVVRLAKRSILDGLGLALAGQVAHTGQLVRDYLAS